MRRFLSEKAKSKVPSTVFPVVPRKVLDMTSEEWRVAAKVVGVLGVSVGVAFLGVYAIGDFALWVYPEPKKIAASVTAMAGSPFELRMEIGGILAGLFVAGGSLFLQLFPRQAYWLYRRFWKIQKPPKFFLRQSNTLGNPSEIEFSPSGKPSAVLLPRVKMMEVNHADTGKRAPPGE